jgi:hypothetical protein
MSFFSATPNRTRVLSRRARPTLEALEDRFVPAGIDPSPVLMFVTDPKTEFQVIKPASYGVLDLSPVKLNGGVLTITGRNVGDTLNVQQNNGGTLEVTLNGALTRFANASAITIINIDLKDDVDQFTYSCVGPTVVDQTMTINMGNGHNTVRMTLDSQISHRLDITHTGGNSEDIVELTVERSVFGTLNFQSNLGNGANHFLAELDGSVDGFGVMNLTVHGGTGVDHMTVNAGDAATALGIAGSASLGIYLHGGSNDDHMTANYRGDVDGALRLWLDGEDDGDTMQAALTFLGTSSGSADIDLFGSFGDDTLTCHASTNRPSLFDALVDGGEGTDSVMALNNVRTTRVP